MKKPFILHTITPLAVLTALAVTGTAQAALTFASTFDSTVTSRADSAQIQAAFHYAENLVSAQYSDNITVRINVGMENNNVAGGSSLFSNNRIVTDYAGVRNALIGDATSANDATATGLANLPVADPSGGATRWVVPSAQAKALGLITDQSLFDGDISFGGTTTEWNFNVNNRAQTGLYDFVGTALHEISEVMGRTSQLDNTGYGFLPFDLFRFTGNGTRGAFSAPLTGVYFSFDNGASNLKNYNDGPPGDNQDWALGDPNDPFNASSSPGYQRDMTGVDLKVIDVIGYNQVVPEPSTSILAAVGLVGIILRRKRSQRSA